jgi:hypothetical protein
MMTLDLLALPLSLSTLCPSLYSSPCLPCNKQDNLPGKCDTQQHKREVTYILATAMMPSRQVISESFNFSIALPFKPKQKYLASIKFNPRTTEGILLGLLENPLNSSRTYEELIQPLQNNHCMTRRQKITFWQLVALSQLLLQNTAAPINQSTLSYHHIW